MDMKAMEALNDFEIIDKPKDIITRRGKFDKIMTALSHLANDKAISLPKKILGDQSFKSWLFGLQCSCRKKANMKVYAIEKGDSIQVFRRED